MYSTYVNNFNMAALLEMPDLADHLITVRQALKTQLHSTNPSFKQPLKQLLTHSGKQLRPSFVIAAASTFNQQVLQACVAVELIHMASLVHDDLMDQTTHRHGQPTVHTSAGSAVAIVLGDYIFATAHQAAENISPKAAALVAQTIKVLCEGQALELHDSFNLQRTKANYTKSIKAKTASLLALACELGALCGGIDPDKQCLFADFGEQFGMAFQLLDDVNDLTEDLTQGNYTWPTLLAIQGSYQADITTALKTQKYQRANDIIRHDNATLQTIELAQNYIKKACRSLPNHYLSHFAAKYMTKEALDG